MVVDRVHELLAEPHCRQGGPNKKHLPGMRKVDLVVRVLTTYNWPSAVVTGAVVTYIGDGIDSGALAKILE